MWNCAKQTESLVFDGVYFHCSVTEHLKQLWEFEDPNSVAVSWDWLHRTGIVDKNITKKKEYVWLKNMIETGHQIFETFNWGNNYEKLRKVSEEWKLKFRSLSNFSETRFANSKRFVFKNILLYLGPIINCLDDWIKAAEENRTNLEASNYKVKNLTTKCLYMEGNKQFFISDQREG